jgi:hypothetical protein
MPNWVFSTLKVSGSEQEVSAFAERASKPIAKSVHDGEAVVESPLSFWNFVRPDDSFMEEYKEKGWYTWNIENWGCKWDSSDACGGIEAPGEALYEFSTPWGQPQQFFEAIVAMYPTLDFELFYSEEQGWGGELAGGGGVWWIVDEWGIPETHEDRFDRFGYCYCEEMRDDEVEYMYDDCPKRLEKEVVESGV